MMGMRLLKGSPKAQEVEATISGTRQKLRVHRHDPSQPGLRAHVPRPEIVGTFKLQGLNLYWQRQTALREEFCHEILRVLAVAAPGLAFGRSQRFQDARRSCLGQGKVDVKPGAINRYVGVPPILCMDWGRDPWGCLPILEILALSGFCSWPRFE